MIISPPDLNYFSLFNINVRFYSICIFIGVVFSLFVAAFMLKHLKTDVKEDIFFDFCPFLIIFSIIGARLYYVLLSLDYFIKNPLSIFMIWRGGIAIHGAFLGGLFYALYYFKKNKISFFPYADLICTVLPLGQAIGRWGNFFNSEAFGVPVSLDLPVALYVPMKYRPFEYINYDYFHPTFLYESILDFFVFAVLFVVFKKTAKKFGGLVFFLYILLYSLIRLPLEYMRIDTIYYLFNVPFPVIISVIGIIAGTIGIIYRFKRTSV